MAGTSCDCAGSTQLHAQSVHIAQLMKQMQLLQTKLEDFQARMNCPLTTFHGFPKLPKELRRKIWKMGLPGRRIVRVERRQLSYPPPVFADYLTNSVGNSDALGGIAGAGGIAAGAALAGAGSALPVLPWRMVNSNGTADNYVGYPNEYSPILEVFDCNNREYGLVIDDRQGEMEMTPNAAGPTLRNPYNDPSTVTFMFGGPKADNRWVMRRRQQIHLGLVLDNGDKEATTLKGSRVPPLLHVCRESREIALEVYDFRLSITPNNPAVTFREWKNFPDLATTMNEVIPHSRMASPGVRFQPRCDMIFLDHSSLILRRKIASEMRTDNIQYLGIAWNLQNQLPCRIWPIVFLAHDQTNQFPNLKTLDLVVSEHEPSVKNSLEVLPTIAKGINAELGIHWIHHYGVQGVLPSPPAPVVRIVTRKDFFAEVDRCNSLAQY